MTLISQMNTFQIEVGASMTLLHSSASSALFA